MHRVFTFGTLKHGFRNFHVNRGVRVGGGVVTAQPYPLYLIGRTGLPWLLDRPGEGVPVVGQLFEVEDGTLTVMDALERVDDPLWYQRKRIQLRPLPAASTPRPSTPGSTLAARRALPVHSAMPTPLLRGPRRAPNPPRNTGGPIRRTNGGATCSGASPALRSNAGCERGRE